MIREKRIDWIDFGKGITVLMVVFGHVLLGMYESNRFVDSERWIRVCKKICV